MAAKMWLLALGGMISGGAWAAPSGDRNAEPVPAPPVWEVAVEPEVATEEHSPLAIPADEPALPMEITQEETSFEADELVVLPLGEGESAPSEEALVIVEETGWRARHPGAWHRIRGSVNMTWVKDWGNRHSWRFRRYSHMAPAAPPVDESADRVEGVEPPPPPPAHAPDSHCERREVRKKGDKKWRTGPYIGGSLGKTRLYGETPWIVGTEVGWAVKRSWVFAFSSYTTSPTTMSGRPHTAGIVMAGVQPGLVLFPRKKLHLRGDLFMGYGVLFDIGSTPGQEIIPFSVTTPRAMLEWNWKDRARLGASVGSRYVHSTGSRNLTAAGASGTEWGLHLRLGWI